MKCNAQHKQHGCLIHYNFFHLLCFLTLYCIHSHTENKKKQQNIRYAYIHITQIRTHEQNNRQDGKLNEQKTDVDIIAYPRAANTNRNENRCLLCSIPGPPYVASTDVRPIAIEKCANECKLQRSLRIFGIVNVNNKLRIKHISQPLSKWGACYILRASKSRQPLERLQKIF